MTIAMIVVVVVRPEVDPRKGKTKKTRKSMNTKKTTIHLPGGFALRSTRDEIKQNKESKEHKENQENQETTKSMIHPPGEGARPEVNPGKGKQGKQGKQRNQRNQ